MATYNLTVGMPTILKESFANSSSMAVSSNMTATYDSNCVTLSVNTATSSSSSAWVNPINFSSSITGSTAETAQTLFITIELKGYSTNVNSYPAVWYRAYKNGSTSLSNWGLASLDGVTGKNINDNKWHTQYATVKTYNGSTVNEIVAVTPIVYPSATVGDKASFRNLKVFNLTAIYGREKFNRGRKNCKFNGASFIRSNKFRRVNI